MILGTWNCCQCALSDKLAELRRFNADVMNTDVMNDLVDADVIVVPESPKLPPGYNGLWDGDDPRMGIAIIPSPTTTLVRNMNVPNLPEDSAILANVTTGSLSFLLLAVWARKKPKYAVGLHRVLDLCEEQKVRPDVVIGDFCSEPKLDHYWPADRNHTALVERLEKLSLKSAYHFHTGEKPGDESEKTHLNSNGKEFHIDYCFLPETWEITKVIVGPGTFEEWKSDHRPLVVTVDEQKLSTSTSASLHPSEALNGTVVSSSAMSPMRSE